MAGFWFLVSGDWSLVTGPWLRVTGCWILLTGYWNLDARCSMKWLTAQGSWFKVKYKWYKVYGVRWRVRFTEQRVFDQIIKSFFAFYLTPSTGFTSGQ
jgi:hypothetical protein